MQEAVIGSAASDRALAVRVANSTKAETDAGMISHSEGWEGHITVSTTAAIMKTGADIATMIMI